MLSLPVWQGRKRIRRSRSLRCRSSKALLIRKPGQPSEVSTACEMRRLCWLEQGKSKPCRSSQRLHEEHCHLHREADSCWRPWHRQYLTMSVHKKANSACGAGVHLCDQRRRAGLFTLTRKTGSIGSLTPPLVPGNALCLIQEVESTDLEHACPVYRRAQARKKFCKAWGERVLQQVTTIEISRSWQGIREFEYSSLSCQVRSRPEPLHRACAQDPGFACDLLAAEAPAMKYWAGR